MKATVSDIVRIMEIIAPPALAEKWDNVGLQVGKRDWPVNTVWLALDPLPSVVAQACEARADMLITHHPLIFRPLESVDFSTPAGSVIQMATQHQLAVFAAHTNLDNVTGGVNDVLASRIGVGSLRVLSGPKFPDHYKLAVYVPRDYEQKVLDALFETDAGKIGEYSCCSFRTPGTGTFRPGDKATPWSGKIGEISHEEEVRIEAVVPGASLKNVILRIRAAHPYETMAYDVYPLESPDADQGLGRVGELDVPLKLSDFALKIRAELGLPSVKVAGDPDLMVHQVAICSGSGSSLMGDFFASGAQVYVTGDLRYHDARDAEAAGKGLIDLGHFPSEHLIVAVLAERLRALLPENGLEAAVEVCGSETDPFMILQ